MSKIISEEVQYTRAFFLQHERVFNIQTLSEKAQVKNLHHKLKGLMVLKIDEAKRVLNVLSNIITELNTIKEVQQLKDFFSKNEKVFNIKNLSAETKVKNLHHKLKGSLKLKQTETQCVLQVLLNLTINNEV